MKKLYFFENFNSYNKMQHHSHQCLKLTIVYDLSLCFIIITFMLETDTKHETE